MGMDEYIRKESAISIFRAKAEMAVCTPAHPYFDRAAKMLELLPAADVATVRHGFWRAFTNPRYCGLDDSGDPIYRDGVLYYCSECARKTVIKERYCPDCGAKMEETDARK